MTVFRSLIFSITILGLTACGGTVELLRDLPEPEANEVMATLIEAGLQPEKLPGKEGTVSLNIEKNQFARAIALLKSEGLPHEKHANMGDIFRKEGMISSPLEERARYLWALSQELSTTVSQIDGVVKARVHVVLPERGNGGEPSLPSSAAVFIKHKPGFSYDDAIPQVKKLVSNSIPGLSLEKVTVVVVPGGARTEQSGGPISATTSESLPPEKNSESSTFSSKSKIEQIKIWSACFLFLTLISIGAYFVWKKWSEISGKFMMPNVFKKPSGESFGAAGIPNKHAIRNEFDE